MSYLQYTVVVEESQSHVGEELEQNPTLLHHVQILNDSKTETEDLEFSLQYIEEHGSECLQNKIKQESF